MKEIIRTILNEWKVRKLPEVLQREIDLFPYTKMNPKKIIVIPGFRRTGKTYLMFNLIMKLLQEIPKEEIVYINFEDERIPSQTQFLSDLLPTLHSFYHKKVRYLFLDEVHNMPNWSKWLRRIYDTEELCIFVTGSSSKMSTKEIPTELRGRYLQHELLPLSFQEFLVFKKIKITKNISSSEEQLIHRSLQEYIDYGGMPEVVLTSEERKLEFIQSYYNSVIRRDIIERNKIRNEEILKACLRLLLNSTTITISKLYNTLKSLQLKTGKGTIHHYLGYIENSYFIYTVSVFSFKMKDQMQYPRKVYFVDVGFLNISNKFSHDYGRKYENIVYLHLRRKVKSPDEIYYWKNAQHEEVDFVLKPGLKVKQLVQVCYDISDYDTKKREIKALLKGSSELKCNNLIVITEDLEKKESIKGKTIKYIPLWKYLLE